MGQLVEGVWHEGAIETKSTGGAFKRTDAAYRNWITPDGAPGPTGEGGFAAESGRYHLYVSFACPWAHRTLIYRKLKGLEPHIDVSVVHPDMLTDGWTFETGYTGATGDRLFGSDYMREIYTRDDPKVSGRVTVPVLWDKAQGRIVSNESSEIIRMFNSAFNDLTGNTDDYAPDAKLDEIDEINARVYDTLNNGVYKSGFASTQEAYEAAVFPLFDTLDWLEERLAQQRFLTGGAPTEADWRLFPTLVRFDAVYHGHFKCNRARIVDYPNLWAYTRDLYTWATPDGGMVGDTVNLDHIRRHYHYSHESINPHRIVSVGPELDFETPHGRDGIGG